MARPRPAGEIRAALGERRRAAVAAVAADLEIPEADLIRQAVDLFLASVKTGACVRENVACVRETSVNAPAAEPRLAEPSRTRADKIPSLQREEEEEETKTKTFVLGSPPEPSDLPSEAFLPGLAPPSKLVEAPSPRKPSAKEVELAWRVQETWAAHADKRRRFFAEVEGTAARPRSSPPPDIAREIRQAILEYDGDLLGTDQREEWRRESWARAAGLGIFLDPWCTAEHPENKMGEPGAKRYLEPWRPWHRQKSKGCPVAKYADVYFQRRALDEGEREAVVASQRPPTAGAGHPQATERPPLAIVRAAGG